MNKLSYLQKNFKSQFLINGFEQGMEFGLEYYLRVEIVDYSVLSYEDFMKNTSKLQKGVKRLLLLRN